MPKKEIARKIDIRPQGSLAGPIGGVYLPPADYGTVRSIVADDGTAKPDSAGVLTMHGSNGIEVKAVAGGVQITTDADQVARTFLPGSMIVSKGTTLLLDLPIGATSLYVADNNKIVAGSNAILRCDSGDEIISIVASLGSTTLPDGTTAYAYTVGRDEGGTGAIHWHAGDVVLNIGTTNGYVLGLHAEAAWNGSSSFGPAVHIDKLLSLAGWVPAAIFGNLRGKYGLANSDIFGVAAGLYAVTGASWMSVDETNGLRVGSNTSLRGQFSNSGVALYDGGGTQRVNLASDGTGWLVGSGKIYWNANGDLTVANINATSGSIGGWTIDSSKLYKTNALISSDGYVSFGATPPTTYGDNVGAWLGYSSGAKLSLYSDASNYLQWDGAKLLIKAANFALDASGNIDANNGTLAGLTVDGTITVGSNGIVQSSGFASGTSGWRIHNDGTAEFANIVARGSIRTAVFEKSLVTAFAGSQMVSKSASVLASDVTLSGSTFTVVVKQQAGGAPFANGDLIYLKTDTLATYATVNTGSASGSNWSYTATYKSGDSSGTVKAGETVVDFGGNGVGVLLLTADQTNAPYLSIKTHDMSNTPVWTEKVRVGNLSGIAGASGYGLWSDNCYLRGVLQVSDGTAVASTTYADQAEADAKAASVPVGGAAADVNANTTTISGGKITTGTITASHISVTDLAAINANLGTITAGTITGATIRTAASGARVEMNNTKIFGTNGTADQWYALASNGKLYAAAGKVIIDSAGIALNNIGTSSSFFKMYEDNSTTQLVTSDGAAMLQVYSESDSGAAQLWLRASDTDSQGDPDFYSMVKIVSGISSTGQTGQIDFVGYKSRFMTTINSFGTFNPRFRFDVADAARFSNGLYAVSDSFSYVGESLANGNLTSGSSWSAAGGMALTSNQAVYTHSAGSGTLTQTRANQALKGRPLRVYEFQYTVSNVSGVCSASITTAFASVTTSLTLYAGTQKTFFLSNANPDSFVISVTSSSGGFTLDSLSLQELTGSDLVVGGTASLNDVNVFGSIKMQRNDTSYTGSVFVPLASPLTSTSWDGDAYSTTSKTLIDLSSVFGAPAGIKGVLMRYAIRDSGADTNNCWLCLSPDNTASSGIFVRCQYGPAASFGDGRWMEGDVIVPTNVDGDIYYQTSASGTGTLDIYLEVWGYYI